MKKTIIFNLLKVFLFLFVATNLIGQEDFRQHAPEAGPAPKIELGKADKFTLENGLQVIVVENHKLPRVSFQLFVDVPPIEEGEYAGYTDIAGQMLNKGTTTKTKSEIDEAIDFMGASLSTSSSGMFGASLTKHKEGLLRIMSDVLLNPSFPPEEFDKIKKQTLSSLAQDKDDPNAIAANVSQVLRYGKNHPYGEVQTEKTTENITVDKCKEYYTNYFKPNISYLIVVGDISEKEARQLASEYFGKWEKGTVDDTKFGMPEMPSKTTLDFVDKAGAVQSVINITYPVDLKPNSENAIKARVMNAMLGGFFGSRLMSNLREDKGFTYGARSQLNADRLVGSFVASASVRNEVTDSSLVEFLVEMNRLRDEPISDDELEMVKSVMSGSFARSLESPQTVARFALNTARYHLPEDYYNTYLENLSKVTKEDILAMAKQYVHPKNAHILVVGNKDEVAEKLAIFSADGKVNFYDTYGNLMEEEGMSVPEGVTAATILEDYINAIGGVDKLKTVKSLKTEMAASVQGMALAMTLFQKVPNKVVMEIGMNGNLMQKSVFDGEKGQIMGGGQTQPMPTEMEENFKATGRLFQEMYYEESGLKPELKGIEMVDGKKTFKLAIKLPDGTTQTEYYDMETNLKVRDVKVENGQTETNDYSDYKEVEGIKFPHTLTITGAMPFPLKMKVQNLEINGAMEDSLFQIQ